MEKGTKKRLHSGISTNADQNKAIKAPQSTPHNDSWCMPGGKGKRPNVKK